jgi:hypothetical protein
MSDSERSDGVRGYCEEGRLRREEKKYLLRGRYRAARGHARQQRLNKTIR